MRISLNWLKKYVKISIPDEELVRLIGARLVEVEGVINETHKYDNIFVVKVETAEKIPDTHLNLCKINAGEIAKSLPKVETDENGFVQVMCGAPNVRAGMLAVWIAPGAVVPASVDEDAPFVIGKRKMLGKYDSYGMLSGADELGFAEEHKTIAEIDPNTATPGTPLANVFDLNDLILDIENKSLTHRPDCFGLIGFAREVAGILGQKFEEPSSEDFSANLTSAFDYENNSALSISVENSTICPRYTAVILEKHGELKKKYLTYEDTILSKSGMRPVDPIVDATNYLMLLTGQPLHAFDYDKFVAVGGSKTPQIIVRLAKNGEKLALLDGKEIVLNDDDIVITSNNVPVALAGAMGGASTMINENTKNIILEAATFSLYNLRKTQMAHGIFSEAITRFTKGQPAYQTLSVAKACANLLSEGFRVSAVSDAYPDPACENTVKITAAEINALLGTDYSEAKIVETLTNVGFKVRKVKDTLEIEAPIWRTDIHIKEDIIEEVGRLNGYDNILPTLPRHFTANKNRLLTLKTKVRNILVNLGANEVLTYSFVSGKLLEKSSQDLKNSYKIVNSISPELQYVRQSLTPSLLEKAYLNQKIPYDEFALFEINKIYQKSWGFDAENVPVEKISLGFVVAERKNQGTAYYKAKMFAENLLSKLEISPRFIPLKDKTAESKPFEPKRSAEIWAGETKLGVVGEFKNSVRRSFKLAEYLAGFELDFDILVQLASDKKTIKIPEQVYARDLTIETDKTYGEIVSKIEEILRKAKVEAKLSPISIYQPADKKHLSFHLEFASAVDDALMRKLEKL